MKSLKSILIGLMLASNLGIAAAYAQTPSSSPSSTPSPKPEIMEVLKSKDPTDLMVPLVFVITMLSGGMGGFIFELINLQGNIERRHRPTEDELAAKLAYASPQNVTDLGVWGRIIIGALAAPPAMLFFRPESVFALLAMSVVAGSGGTAVFRSLQDRLLIAISQQEKIEEEIQIRKPRLIAKVEEAIAAFEKLEKELRTIAHSADGTNDLLFAKGTTLQFSLLELFDAVRTPLAQAQGISSQVNEALEDLDAIEAILTTHSQSLSGETKLELTDNIQIKADLLRHLKNHLNFVRGVNEVTATAEDEETEVSADCNSRARVLQANGRGASN